MSDPIVRIFDTTLRDGEQAPGCTMHLSEKLEVARQLARLKVDIIEAGFPAASRGDLEAVQAIAREVGTADGPVICGLARANKGDIDACWEAIQPAAKKRIHTFLSTSDIHITHQLRSTREAVLQQARESVAYARALCDDVEFSPMDASRSDPDYLHQVLAAAIEAGATTLNIPDTVGYATPAEYGAMIAGIIASVPGAAQVTISTHCHDDLGLAVANSLAGVQAGARQIECTINGIGERAGNASLEEVVMALTTRAQSYGLRTNVETRQLTPASRLVSQSTGAPVPPNKAVVGANAFAHESGIHQDGVLKHRETYEIMTAESVGQQGNALVLGKHSGRHAFRHRVQELGYSFGDAELNHLFGRFKELADRKKYIDDRDIEALVADEAQRPAPIYELEHVQFASGTSAIPTATVRIRQANGEVKIESGQGTGPIDAVYSAINKVVQTPVTLLEFAVNAITEGIDAVGEVSVQVQEGQRENQRNGSPKDANGRVWKGYGVNLDIIVAAAEAYVAALNKLLQARQERLRADTASRYAAELPLHSVDLFGGSALGQAAE
ncbi:MAG TPA: 2-isopropylmalate synthase [Herpetosiphonaceae bacterium]